MKNILKYLTIMTLLISSLQGAPARGGLHRFKQADGTTFQGYLKGDAAFHWIESDGKVVLFNNKDKFYYYAKISADKKFVLSKEKVVSNSASWKILRASAKESSQVQQGVSKESRAVIYKLQKESRVGHYPR